MNTRPILVDMPTLIRNVEAERAAAAGLFYSADVDSILALLEPGIVTDPTLNAICEIARALRDRRAPVEPVAVWSEARRRGWDAQVGSLSAVVALSKEAIGGTGPYHAREVVRCATLRNLAEAAGKIGGMAYEAQDADEAAAQALAMIQGVIDGTRQSADIVSIGESAQVIWQGVNSGSTPGVMTGYTDYDQLTGGLHGGELTILAARPGEGKTTFALNIADRVASKGVRVLIASLEMGADELTRKVLALRSRINSQVIRLHGLSQTEMPRLADAVKSLTHTPIDILAPPSLSIGLLRARARAWRAQVRGPALIIVDYLQLLRGDERRRDSRVAEVGEISQVSKAIARELDVPVFALAQMNRSIEGRTSHIPLLSDLRESGSLEQDADNVVFIYREERYDPDTDKKGISELHIAKQRNGPVGIVPLRFDPSTSAFHNLSYGRDVEGY